MSNRRLSIAEAATAAQVHPAVVRKFIKWGLVPVFREWRGVRVNEVDVLRVAAKWRERMTRKNARPEPGDA